MLSEVHSNPGVRGGSELHERESMMNWNENPKEGGPTGPRRAGEMA